MKNTRLFYLLAAAVVALTAVSCTTGQMMADENYPDRRQAGERIYIQDPYAGTIVLERDPYTGRYYDVTYGNSNGYYGYNPYYNSRYNDRYYYRNRYPRNTRVTPQKPTQEEQQQYQRNRDEARKKVLGRN
ncbi:MAG: hypothetical protein ACO1OO_08950 [Flavisolibacter sp.]